MELSILNKAKPEDIHTTPYPYIVIENALNDTLYEELSKSYPSDSDIIGDAEVKNLRN